MPKKIAKKRVIKKEVKRAEEIESVDLPFESYDGPIYYAEDGIAVSGVAVK